MERGFVIRFIGPVPPAADPYPPLRTTKNGSLTRHKTSPPGSPLLDCGGRVRNEWRHRFRAAPLRILPHRVLPQGGVATHLPQYPITDNRRPAPTPMPANNKSKLTMIAVLGAIFLGAILCALPFLSKQLGRALIAETAANGRSTKLVMDIFASDNDGLYPGEDSAEFYEIAGSATSNDLFKQLFSSGNMNSEKHFWIKGAKICNEDEPDDVITIDEKFNPPETLKAGDNGWSYFAGLKNTDHPDHPLLTAPFHNDLKAIDPEVFQGRALIVFIDGSSRSFPLTDDGLPTNDMGFDLLHQLPNSKSPTTLLHPDPATSNP